ncbi:MAG: YARHG domain-containing protein [Leadbetterella sp.]
MKNLNHVILSILVSLQTTSILAQIPKTIFNQDTGERFDSKNFTISNSSVHKIIGIYHLGESESEWDLIFFPFNDGLIIQVLSSVWGEEIGVKRQARFQLCQTFNNVIVKGNTFYFGKHSGQFVDYLEGKNKTKAVLLFSDLIEGRNYNKDSAEVGFYDTSIETYFDDKERYELSLEVKPESYFSSKTKQELKILRNTIFANYGQIFQKDGEIHKYFSKKRWYIPWQKDTSAFLTAIERKNLATLKKFE